MGAMAFQITSLTSVYSTLYSGADQRKHQSSVSLAFVWGLHRSSVNSPHKWPVTENVSIWWRHHGRTSPANLKSSSISGGEIIRRYVCPSWWSYRWLWQYTGSSCVTPILPGTVTLWVFFSTHWNRIVEEWMNENPQEFFTEILVIDTPVAPFTNMV